MATRSEHSTGPNRIYRGVHAKHPVLAGALNGQVIPGNPTGKVTPEEHNEGGRQADSPYTSWTRNRQIAMNYARRQGPGGIILSFPTGAPRAGDKWAFAWAPDECGEDEILLRGERAGATVEVV